MDKLILINQVIKEYFASKQSINLILAKDLMPQFIEAGIFNKDHREGLPIRKILIDLDEKQQLHLIPTVYAERKNVNTNWYFQRRDNLEFKLPKENTNSPSLKTITRFNDKDEHYVLNLCDNILDQSGKRQHRFDFLRGDSDTKLPVDIYYPELNLVIEYKEYQHSNPVSHFDKPDIMTVSGVHRGEQRKIYDQRRRDVLPQNGITLIEIDYTDFPYDRKSRILRDQERDLRIAKGKLISFMKI